MFEHCKDYLSHLRALLQDKRGVAAMEYGFIAGLTSIVIAAATAMFGTAIPDVFTRIEILLR